MTEKALWLIAVTGLAVVLLAVAFLVQSPDIAGKVLAILAIVAGGLVAVGPKMFTNGNHK